MNGQVHVGKEDKKVKQHLNTEIILINVHNMTILAKVCHVKLNKKESIYMEGM